MQGTGLRVIATIGLLMLGASVGCAPHPNEPALRLEQVMLADTPRPLSQPILLRSASNETVHLTLEVGPLPSAAQRAAVAMVLEPMRQLGPAQDGRPGLIPLSAFRAYQVLALPVNTNHAGYVRHTGLDASLRHLPRALLPLTIRDGRIDLSSLRNPADPTNPGSTAAGKSTLLWLDITVPSGTAPGEYASNIQCMVDGRPVVTLPLNIIVHDFALPDEPSLVMSSQVNWSTLQRLYPRVLEGVTPEYINRADAKYAPAVALLDQLVQVAHQHRASVSFPRLGPVVKWGFDPAAPPTCHWEDFDSLVGPWLSGQGFANRVPLGFWPLPRTPQYDQLQPQAQRAYWQAVASHFEQLDWMGRCAATLEPAGPGRISPPMALLLSADAATVLGAHLKLRVAVPVEEDQLHLNQNATTGLVDPADLPRLLTASPALVTHPVPPDRSRSGRWLRTDVEGLIPYAGAGTDQREIRLWAWLAFLRQATLVRWASPLPSRHDARSPAEPDELVWFYPGTWFGTDQPLPSIQLKWLMRAQQDYEYLNLARKRGQWVPAMIMARLMAKPVELDPRQSPDPAYGLMCGTSDPEAWRQGLELLARAITLRPTSQPASPADEAAFGQAVLAWMQPQERPMLMGRSAAWGFALGKAGKGLDPDLVDLRLELDIYNAADTRPSKNRLQWTGLPAESGWKVSPNPNLIPELLMYRVVPARIEAQVQLRHISPLTRQPVDITFIDGENRRQTLLRLRLPVAACERREGIVPRLDGSLDDWNDADSIHEGKLVKMLSRPAVQRQELVMASTSSQLFSAWTGVHLHLAFRLEGAQAPGSGLARGAVETYQFRRAWGEDLAEVMVQPIYADNTAGPLVHLICRPGGQIEVDRRPAGRNRAAPLEPILGAGVRYVTTVQQEQSSAGHVWRGELAIPWTLLNEPGQARQPALLRFNFVQHRHATGESASWAGPVDFGRDENLMGLLVLRSFHWEKP